MPGRLQKCWRENGLATRLHFVPWLEQNRMRLLYGAADVTLCLGNAPEAFGGNVALESLACGTPVVATRVGAYRNTLPGTWLQLVWYGMELDTADAVQSALQGHKKPTEKTVATVRSEFSFNKMLRQYEEAILTARVLRPIKTRSLSEYLLTLRYG